MNFFFFFKFHCKIISDADLGSRSAIVIWSDISLSWGITTMIMFGLAKSFFFFFYFFLEFSYVNHFVDSLCLILNIPRHFHGRWEIQLKVKGEKWRGNGKGRKFLQNGVKKCLKIVSFWVVNVKTLSSFVRCGKEESQMGEWEWSKYTICTLAKKLGDLVELPSLVWS